MHDLRVACTRPLYHKELQDEQHGQVYLRTLGQGSLCKYLHHEVAAVAEELFLRRAGAASAGEAAVCARVASGGRAA